MSAGHKAATREYAKRKPMSLCRCGHSGDGANSMHAPIPGPARALMRGCGPCLATGCGCTRFFWEDWTDDFKAWAEGGGGR